MRLKRIFRNTGSAFLLLLIVAVGCTKIAPGRGVETEVPREHHVVIFHFNDLHGRIERLARMATIVRGEREKGSEVYLFCAGDNFSGNPLVDQAEPKGEPVLELLNTLDVDVMVLGNHEFDYGQPVLKNFIRRLRFPVICANLEFPEKEWPPLAPHVMLGKEGDIPLRVLGLIQIEHESRIPSTHPSRVKGLTFQDFLETVSRFPNLRPPGGVLIALSHLGYSADRILAERSPAIDLIVGGHSHTALESGTLHNGVLITQTGAHGDFLGRVDLRVRDGKVVEKKAHLIDLSSVPGAEDMAAMVKQFEDNPVMQRVLAKLERPLDGKTELGNWICDMMRQRLKLDVAFQNSGGVRLQRLEGEIRLKDVYQMLPFGNTVIRMEMFPREIRNLLRYDIKNQGKLDLLVSGLNIRMVRAPDGSISQIYLRNSEGLLDEDKRYAVGFNSYIASAYRFSHEDPGRSLEITMAETVIAYLESREPLIPADPSLRVESEIQGQSGGAVSARSDVVIETGKNPFSGSSVAGNLIADAMCQMTESQLAMYPSRLLVPGIRIPAGHLIGGNELRAMFKYTDRNRVRVVQINGRSLAAFLLKRARYRRGADLQVSGMKCRIRVSGNEEVEGIDCKIMPGGREIDEARSYRVALIDYDLEKYYDLEGGIAEKTKADAPLVEDVLRMYLQRYPRIDESIAAPRVTVQTENRGR